MQTSNHNNKLSKIFILLMMLSSFTQQICAYSFASNGIFYNITSSSAKTVEVTYETSKYNSYSDEVIIPMIVTYNSVIYKVTSVGPKAFSDCETLTKVHLPATITKIGVDAFYFCSNLTDANIPSAVTTIEEGIFYGCTSLKNISIPDGVKTIGDNAFKYCKSLSKITIPKAVTDIGSMAFAYCSGLESFIVEEGNTYFDSRENCNALVQTSSNTLLFGTKNTIIPSSITSIGEMAFYNLTSLTSIEIPSSVTSISGYAFAGCSKLEYVNMSNSVTAIGRDVFEHCTSLKAITLSEALTTIPDEVFYDCSSLISIEIPKNVTKIGKSAFYMCTSLESLFIPSSVTNLSGYAFYGCKSLKDITLKTIGNPLSTLYTTFYKVPMSSVTLHVKRKYKELYKEHSFWGTCKEILNLPSIRGDINDDEVIDVIDINELEDAIINDKYISTDEEFFYNDVNKNGKVNVADITDLVKIMESGVISYENIDERTDSKTIQQ